MKIVVAEPLGVAKDHVEAAMGAYPRLESTSLTVWETPPADDADMIRRCADAEVVIEVNRPLNADFFAACKKLRLVAVAFAGIDHIDIAAAAKAGVTVKNCPGYCADAVAELVFGLVTVVQRRLVAFDAATRRGGSRDGFIGRELRGKNFGIVGYGHIGKRVATLAKAYGCDVFATTRHPGSDGDVTFLPLKELVATCDVVSLHLPLTEESRDLFDAATIAAMKDGAILINTARGPIVDSEALLAAVESGHLAGAGIDVFETEPPLAADHPLCRSDHIVVTPHIGFATGEAFATRLAMTFENIDDFFATRT